MKSRAEIVLIALLTILLLPACNSGKREDHKQPNIVFIYMDDLGYGDVGVYGATELKTPNMDALANGGIRFTDAHASSATCSPSRYALLTGSYPWRNERAKILAGTAPLLIAEDEMTLPKALQEMGYHTAVVGKWHMGLGAGNVNWNEHISPGPNEVGFDYSYIMAATQDRVPTVYIENGDVVGLDPNDPIEINYKKNFEGEPTGKDNPELLTMKWHHGHYASIVNGISRIGYMKGGDAAKWSDVDMADHFLAKAQGYVKEQKEGPFFLYYAFQQPHVPRTPHPRFEGTSGMGPRGDVIVEADWCLGEFMKTLEDEGLLENTLLVFSSDNGPVLNDGYYDDAVELIGDHKPAGDWRGGKYSLFEAGTRVPLMISWKGVVEPGVCDALVSQIDLFASISELVGSDKTGPDSENLLDVFLGTSDKGREDYVLEATSRTAYRKGDWVMIPPYSGVKVIPTVNIETGNDTSYQLYNLNADAQQLNNLAETEGDKLQEMIDDYETILGDSKKQTEKLILH